MPITSTGIGSGLDVESLVAQLVLADTQPVENRLNKKEVSYQAELTAYGTVKSALSSFQTSVSAAADSSQYLGKTATTSLYDTVTATATEVAPPGDYLIEVSALASEQSLASASYAATTTEVGTGTLTINLGTVTYDSSAGSVTGFSGKSGASAVTVSIGSSNNSLTGVRDAINAASTDVSASIVNDGSGYRLVLRSANSGAENAITISVSDTGDSNSTDNAGLSKLAFDQTTAHLTQTNAGSDAALKINGLSVAATSNSVAEAVEGITFSLKKVTASPVTITIDKDTAKAKAAVQTFVDSYNQLNTELTTLTSYNASTVTGSVFTGDATIRNLAQNVRSALNDTVSNAGGNYKTLAELGVTTNVIDGSLTLDGTKLDNILENDAADVAVVLGSFGTPSNANVQYVSSTSKTEAGTYSVSGSSTTSYTINGSATTQVDNVITGAVGTAVEGLSLKILGNATGDLGNISFSRGLANPLDSLITKLLADDGLIDARLDGIAKSVEDITDQRATLALRVDALENRYRNQFNGLETLISQLNTTQSFLTTALSQFVDPLSFKK